MLQMRHISAVAPNGSCASLFMRYRTLKSASCILFIYYYLRGERAGDLRGVWEAKDTLYIDAGLSQHLDLRACAARCSTRSRGQVSEERCQGERGPRKRDMVRDRATHAQHVRRGRINLWFE